MQLVSAATIRDDEACSEQMILQQIGFFQPFGEMTEVSNG